MGMRVDEPLSIPTMGEYFAETGRVVIADDYHAYAPDTPFNLHDGPGPAVLGTFSWSGLWIDGLLNVDLTEYFFSAQIRDELPYNVWRIRGIWRTGYTQYFATVPPASPIFGVSALTVVGESWNRVAPERWALAADSSSNLIGPWPGNPSSMFFFGGPPGMPISVWFQVNFQIEVGYGGRQNAYDTALRVEGDWDWPAFRAGIRTDYGAYRGSSGVWNCYNGRANAPNVDPSCPYKSATYTPPAEPPDA